MERLKKILVVLLGQGLNALVSFLLMPYLARSLSKIEYANYGQTLLVVTTIISILVAGFIKSLYVYLSRETQNKNPVITGNILVALTLSLSAAITLYAGAPWIASQFGNSDIAGYLRIYCWVLPMVVPYYALNAVLIYNDRIKSSSIISVSTNAVKAALLFVAIQKYESLQLVFIILTCLPFLQITAVLIASRGLWKIDFKESWKLGSEQLRLGVPLGLSAILGVMIVQMDGLMISGFMGQESYSNYRNGAWEVPMIGTIYASISTIILPEVAKLWAKTDIKEIIRLKALAITNTALITLPILVFLILNSKSIIVTLFSELYVESWPIFAIFNLTLLIRINDYSDILVSSSNTKYISRYYFTAMVFNLVLNLVLINALGIVGAAIATVGSIALLAILQARKTTQILTCTLSDLFEPKTLMKILFFSLLIFAFSWPISTLLSVSPLLRLIVQGVIYFSIASVIFIKSGLVHPLILNKLGIKPKKL